MNITYVKMGLNKDVERLLVKLEPRYPSLKIMEEIAEGFATPNGVFVDGKLNGILLLRGVKDYNENMVLVVDHAIAEDNLDYAFSSILQKSLFSFACSKGFKFIHQHADRPGLAKMLEGTYGKPEEWIFKKDLTIWAKAHQALTPLKPQQAQPRT